MFKSIASFAIAFFSVATVLGPKAPAGSYILVRYTPTGYVGGQEIRTDLVLNDQVICTWNLGQTQPWDRGENYLYFIPSEDNCPGLDPRNFVQWNVLKNSGEVFFKTEKVLEIPVWTRDGAGKYSLLPQ